MFKDDIICFTVAWHQKPELLNDSGALLFHHKWLCMETITFNQKDIADMNKGFRRNLINTVHGFKSGNLIGTIGKDRVSNLAIFNSVVHIGANPPYIGFIRRPIAVVRNTYDNLKATGYFTINSIQMEFINAAHHTSAKYPPEVSEFGKTGLTEEYSEIHPAPYVKESAIKIGLKYADEYCIKLNNTMLIVGEVVEVKLPEHLIDDDGTVYPDRDDTICISGLEAYYKPELIKRLAYARPDQPTEVIRMPARK